MPFIDVSDLLSDPDIAGQSFSVIRSITAVPVGGRTQTTVADPIPCIGSVQPATSDELLRMPDAERVGGAITVRTAFPLSSGGINVVSGVDYTADQVVFNGVTYTVQSVQDFTDFGVGMSKRFVRSAI